jgi:hypothetical protein
MKVAHQGALPLTPVMRALPNRVRPCDMVLRAPVQANRKTTSAAVVEPPHPVGDGQTRGGCLRVQR